MKLLIIITTIIFAVGLIVFLIIRNQKDEKELENKLNNDYPKSPDKESDVTTDEPNNEEAL